MPSQPLGKRYYMACLDLQGMAALVVGAGRIALEKIEGLLVAGAEVHVVASQVDDAVERLADEGRITVTRRNYEATDVDAAFIVIAATDDPDVNRQIHDDCRDRQKLINVVDTPRLCNFILPAVIRQGPIAVAVSTGGASPALAKRLKREIGSFLGPEHARLAELLNEVRDWAKETLATYEDRKSFFEQIVDGAPDPIELLRGGREEDLRHLIEASKDRDLEAL